ncbi:MAG: hypothetical protein ACRBBN_07150 [Methyloligellaceae bacterium]
MKIRNIFRFVSVFIAGTVLMISGSAAYDRCLEPYRVSASASGLNLNSVSIGNVARSAQRKLRRKVHLFQRRERFLVQREPTYSMRLRCWCRGTPRRVLPGERFRVSCTGRLTICEGPAVFYNPNRCTWVRSRY